MAELGIGSPRVAVVTVTYNSADLLPDFLRTLERQSGLRIDLVAVDNASSDTTVEILESAGSLLNVHVIRNTENRGVAAANNQGIRRAIQIGVESVLLMNNDTFTDDGKMIEQLVDKARGHQAGVFTPVIAATEPSNTVWFSGGRIYPWRGYQVKHVAMGSPMSAVPAGTWRTQYAPTCCLLVPTGVFDSVGFMDEDFFVYGDDVDFSLRLAAARIPTWVVGDLQLQHRASSLTGGFLSDFTIKWLTRNWMLVCKKHGSIYTRITGIAYFQVWSFARLLARRESGRQFLLRQKAFLEGLRQPLSKARR